MKRRTIAIPGVFLLCLPLVSNADMRVNPFIAGGATFGGDSVGSYTEFLWAEVTEVSVDAGETVFVYGGASLLWPDDTEKPDFGVMIQGGALYGGPDYSGVVEFDREAIEALGIVELPLIRLGIGVSWHPSPELENSSVFGPSTRFSDATGTVIQVDWLRERLTLGARYVDVEYKSGSTRLDASNFGIIVGWRFGRLGGDQAD